MSKAAMPDSINASCHTAAMPKPSIITFFTACMYHLAGMILEIHCRTAGMLSMGKIMPESNMTGIISPIPDTIMAATWFCTTHEMSNPNDRATAIRRRLKKDSVQRLPSTGTCST